jgi:hypothetical protein
MEKIKDYTFNDIILYSKGWYKGTGNICEDLGYFFSKIYWVSDYNEGTIAMRMLHLLDDIYNKLSLNRNPEHLAGKWLATHSQFEGEVRRLMMLYNYNRDMAIIHAVLGVLHSMTCDEIELKPPVFGKKERFRLGCIGYEYPISQTYKEMNRIAQKSFSK